MTDKDIVSNLLEKYLENDFDSKSEVLIFRCGSCEITSHDGVMALNEAAERSIPEMICIILEEIKKS